MGRRSWVFLPTLLDLCTQTIFVFVGYKLPEFRFEPYGCETSLCTKLLDKCLRGSTKYCFPCQVCLKQVWWKEYLHIYFQLQHFLKYEYSYKPFIYVNTYANKYFFCFVFDNVFIYFIIISGKYWLILYSNSEIRV